MTDQDSALREVSALVVGALLYTPLPLDSAADAVYRRLSLPYGATAGEVEARLRDALGLPTASCAYCEDDPDHPDPDNPGTCTCTSPGCGRGWCPQRDAAAEAAGRG